MKKKLFLVLISSLFILSGCNQTPKKDIQITTVRPFTVTEKDYTDSISYTGYVSSDELKRFSFELSGKIESIPVEKGDYVKAGQVIAVLDKEKVQTGVDTAEENVKLAQGNVNTAKSSITLAEENINLADNKIISAQSAIDEVNIGIEADKKTLSKIETSIDSEKINLEKIKSNYNSSISKIKLNYNNYEKTYNDTKKLYESGIVTKDDLDKAKLAYDTVSEELLNAQNTMENDIKLEEKKIESLQQDYSLQQSQIQDKENKLEQAKQQKQAAEISKKQAQISLEQAKTSYSQSNTSLSQANIALDDAKNNSHKTILTSTIDGYVTQIPMKAGEVTSAGTPVVVIKSGHEIVNVSIPAEDYDKFSVGMNARITQNNKEYYGTITTIELYPDENTRTYNMEITPTENTDFAMSSLVNVSISLDKQKSVSIPLSSIVNKDNIDYVYTISKNEKNENIIISRQVNILQSDGENVFVSGIENGTVIAADEIKQLYDNQIVELSGE